MSTGMFTGIVEEMGTVGSVAPRLTIAAPVVGEGSAIGASVAVDGVCLTVVERAAGLLSFDLSPETVTRSTLGRLRVADRVNLERPVTPEGRLGGHLVQGHVDGVGVIEQARDVETGRTVRVRLPHGLSRYVVEKGSITVNGVSLTVTDVDADVFGIALVPFTLEVTNLGAARPGDDVNLEVDIIARYVERLLQEAG